MEPYANSWRMDDDISNSWDSLLRVLSNAYGLSPYAGPGGWNDLDMLEVCLLDHRCTSRAPHVRVIPYRTRLYRRDRGALSTSVPLYFRLFVCLTPQVGNFNDDHSDAESAAHFALWALYKSPLLIGTDLRKASNATKAILQVRRGCRQRLGDSRPLALAAATPYAHTPSNQHMHPCTYESSLVTLALLSATIAGP